MIKDSRLSGSTDIVIIGAGIVGSSVAYHLTQLDRSDVTVVEQGPIFDTGGSTTHAPGGLRQTNPNWTLSKLAQYSKKMFTDLGAFRQSGSVEIATTEARWEYLKRMHDYSKSWNIDGAQLLSPEEVREYNALIDTSKLVGGYYVPDDGQIRTMDLLEKLGETAMDQGAVFHQHTRVTDIEVDDGEVSAVVTDRGTIRTDHILVAANIWSPLIGEMVGIDIPLVPCEHQYAITESIDELEGATTETEDPGVRHQDGSMYFHQHGKGYGIGNYNHDARVVPPEAILSHENAPKEAPVNGYEVGKDTPNERMKMPSTRTFTEEDFKQAWQETVDLFPSFKGVNIDRAYNGMFCFTPDGMPILGEAPSVDGFWIAAAVWITQAGGVGRAMAEWMTNGTPDLPVHGCDITRFQPHAGSPSFVADRGAESYETVYNIVHPRAPSRSQRNLRRSPFYHQQSDLGAEFYDFAGWERARWYEANRNLLDEFEIPYRSGWEAEYWSPISGAEHRAVRDRVGLFDQSSLTGIDIEGPDAHSFVQRLFSNDLDIPIGKMVYTTLLNEAGGIVGDMPVIRLDDDEFRVMASSGSVGTKQLAWIRSHILDDEAVVVTNTVSGECGIGLWGPKARAVLESACSADLSNDAFPYYTAQEIHVGSVPVLALRMSYVGELGWELHAPTEYGAALWDTLWNAGVEYDIVPIGSTALNSMRLEKGIRRIGVDIHSEYNPLEAGLGFTVSFDSGDFVGRDALLAIDEQGVDRKLVCLTLDKHDTVVNSGMPVYDGEKKVGYLTSADYGYSIDRGVAYGYLPIKYADPGTNVQIQYEGDRYAATVREEPLFDSDRERLLA